MTLASNKIRMIDHSTTNSSSNPLSETTTINELNLNRTSTYKHSPYGMIRTPLSPNTSMDYYTTMPQMKFNYEPPPPPPVYHQANQEAKPFNMTKTVKKIVDSLEIDLARQMKRRPSGQYDSSPHPLLTAALLEEKKQSIKKQKAHRKASQCSSASISPTYSTEQHSSLLSRSPSPNRKSSSFNCRNSFSNINQSSSQNNYMNREQFKYRVNSRSPSPVLNFRPVNNFQTLPTSEDIYLNHQQQQQHQQQSQSSQQLKQTSSQPNRKLLPQIPTVSTPSSNKSAINFQDEYELRNLNTIQPPYFVNQVRPASQHLDTISDERTHLMTPSLNQKNSNHLDQHEDCC